MISRHSLLLPFLVLFLFVSSTACVTGKGQSSGKMKRTMQNSFLFKSADIFYPHGVPPDPNQLPSLQKEQVKEIDEVLHVVLNQVAKIHKKYVGRISNAFGRPISPEIKANLVLMDTDNPIAFIDFTGDVNIDVKIVQAMYRTALVSGLRDNRGFFGLSMDGDVPEQKLLDEREIIEQFLAVKKSVDTSRGRTKFGDLGDVLEELRDGDYKGSLPTLVDLAQKSMIVERHYFGTIGFLLAHEFGHGILGHLEAKRRLKNSDCAAFHDMETEADYYALILLYLKATETGMTAFAALGDDVLGIQSSFGFDDFFEYTYDFSGFATTGTALCTHPAPKERLQRIEKLYQSLLEGTWQQMINLTIPKQ